MEQQGGCEARRRTIRWSDKKRVKKDEEQKTGTQNKKKKKLEQQKEGVKREGNKEQERRDRTAEIKRTFSVE